MTDIICLACTLPIPDGERVTVQFEGAPDEVWHRDCFERERREFHGGAPERMTRADIAEAFGVTLRTVDRWRNQGFPAPVGRRPGELEWDRDAVMAWEPPKMGRPRRVDSETT